MDSQFVKRLKSFTWRLGMAIIAFGVAWTAENLQLLDLSTQVTVVLALILGELSKYLNTAPRV